MSKKPIDYFFEIMSIPRESGNELAMVAYLKNFAEKNGLQFLVDEFKNVLIKKQTSLQPALILQAHTDMVCVSKDPKFNFATQKIEPITIGQKLFANGTSLGADNGIGVALILALLSQDFPMNIEAVFTAEEETTMHGAKNFDTKLLTAKHMLSLDGSEESCVDVSSASSHTVAVETDRQFWLEVKDNVFKLEVSGLLGGHSGVDVGKNRGHAFKVLVDFFEILGNDVKLIQINAKSKSNEIPTTASAVFETKKTKDELSTLAQDFFTRLSNKIYAPKLKINLSRLNLEKNQKSLANTQDLLEFLSKIDFGVVKEKEGNVLISSNPYEINLENKLVKIHFRANAKADDIWYYDNLEQIAKAHNYSLHNLSYLPNFEAKQNSALLKTLKASHKKVYGKALIENHIHAGVEAAIFAEKEQAMDILVIGPNIKDMHSVNENVEVPSIERVFEWLKEIVKNFKG